ncbi:MULTISPECIES: NAD(P)/FAD-dependent oxidoreductase [Prauserella salsuginis group]|uniref:NAD(P)/FAD-dependent oxidoreductase n=1 Tax=Prauserella salsuginis TaxID=387889 RepID=A0ABW6G9N1_9PSEU|nr:MULTISPECIES: FAD-dependent oxidoreductase [Prauserella salsuginis group]MCR3721622.1 NADH dehydrogenase, FAD-containing subunit [Prauserella flava]MCR3734314.1 NADH dehydrogenase, FAD-containing subunit [Prauserella salsuginis]
MAHRIVILGGGYAGVTAANRIARRLDGAEVTLVNERATFVERVRLHQVAVGESIVLRPLRERVRPGVTVVVARAGGIDLDRREVVLERGASSGAQRLPYDTLVYALGSQAAPAPDDAVALATVDDAWRARDRVGALAAEPGPVAVVGGGLTGIEAATELAERHPAVRVRVVSDVDPGSWLSHRAQRHLRRVFGRLGIEVVSGSVADVRDGAVQLTDGRVVGAGLTLACTGFAVPSLAAGSGLAVDGTGRIRVDGTMRSVSHPDVYAVGDAAVPELPNGRDFRMACATALPMSAAAGTAIADRLAGRKPAGLRFRYVNQCISLGRRDGVIQAVDGDDSPLRMILGGRVAASYKEAVVRGASWFAAHPGPYRPARAVPA